METSLSGEVTDGFTLGASIVAASNSIDSEHLDVKGMSLDVYAITGFWDFLPVSRLDYISYTKKIFLEFIDSPDI